MPSICVSARRIPASSRLALGDASPASANWDAPSACPCGLPGWQCLCPFRAGCGGAEPPATVYVAAHERQYAMAAYVGDEEVWSTSAANPHASLAEVRVDALRIALEWAVGRPRTQVALWADTSCKTQVAQVLGTAGCSAEHLRPLVAQAKEALRELQRRKGAPVLRTSHIRDSVRLREVHNLAQAATDSLAEPSAQHVVHGLVQQVERLGFRVRECGGAGDCLYRSLAYLMQGNAGNHSSVRKAAHQEMAAFAGRYRDHVSGDWEAYLSQVGTAGAWGDHLSLQACCRVFGVRVGVLDVGPEGQLRLTTIVHDGGEHALDHTFFLLGYTGTHYFAVIRDPQLGGGYEALMDACTFPATELATDAPPPSNKPKPSPKAPVPPPKLVPDFWALPVASREDVVNGPAVIGWDDNLATGVRRLRENAQLVLVGPSPIPGCPHQRHWNVLVRLSDGSTRMERLWVSSIGDPSDARRKLEPESGGVGRSVCVVLRTRVQGGERRHQALLRMRGVVDTRATKTRDLDGSVEAMFDVPAGELEARLRGSGNGGVFVRTKHETPGDAPPLALLWSATEAEARAQMGVLGGASLQHGVFGLAVGDRGYAVRVHRDDRASALMALSTAEVRRTFRIRNVPSHVAASRLRAVLLEKLHWQVEVSPDTPITAGYFLVTSGSRPSSFHPVVFSQLLSIEEVTGNRNLLPRTFPANPPAAGSSYASALRGGTRPSAGPRACAWCSPSQSAPGEPLGCTTAASTPTAGYPCVDAAAG